LECPNTAQGARVAAESRRPEEPIVDEVALRDREVAHAPPGLGPWRGFGRLARIGA